MLAQIHKFEKKHGLSSSSNTAAAAQPNRRGVRGGYEVQILLPSLLLIYSVTLTGNFILAFLVLVYY